MKRKEYEDIVNEFLTGNAKKLAHEQIDKFYLAQSYKLPKNRYSIGDEVLLKKGTLLHGINKNMAGFKNICKNGLISSWFKNGKMTSKYPKCVSVWNLRKNFALKDYIDFYSGGTMKYCRLIRRNGKYISKERFEIVPYSKMPSINDLVTNATCRSWFMEQTKETRFMPCFTQEKVQIAVIFNGANKYTKSLLQGDILDCSLVNDADAENFVVDGYYDTFVSHRKNKDALFTDRESAIIFGLPSNLIEGVLVGRKFEKDSNTLAQIKSLLPNAYICNLDGVVIY